MELLHIIKRLYFLQYGSLKTYQKCFGHYLGIKEYNSFSTKYKRNFLLYYLHSGKSITKDIDRFIMLKSRSNTNPKLNTITKV